MRFIRFVLLYTIAMPYCDLNNDFKRTYHEIGKPSCTLEMLSKAILGNEIRRSKTGFTDYPRTKLIREPLEKVVECNPFESRSYHRKG